MTVNDAVDIVMRLKDTCAVKITINHYGICHLWSRKKWDCIWTYHGFWGGDSDAVGDSYVEQSGVLQEREAASISEKQSI